MQPQEMHSKRSCWPVALAQYAFTCAENRCVSVLLYCSQARGAGARIDYTNIIKQQVKRPYSNTGSVLKGSVQTSSAQSNRSSGDSSDLLRAVRQQIQ
jgi:hypothetical protein